MSCPGVGTALGFYSQFVTRRSRGGAATRHVLGMLPAMNVRWLPRLFVVALLVACAPAAGGPVGFDSRGVRLSGILQLPAGAAGPVPAVVLVHGSGRVTARAMIDREGRRLTQMGLAVLAYDKRGVGDSGGEYTGIGPGNSVRMFDLLAADALAAVALLRARKEIDPRRIGLVGISQGGWIAPLAASRSAHVSFVVTISGPAVSVGEEIAYSDLAGDDPGSIQGLADDEIDRRMREFRGPHGYDPRTALESMRVPSLWLLGEHDRSIPLRKTVSVLGEIAQRGRPITTHVFPGLNHGLRNPVTGEQPDFWNVIYSWLRSQNMLPA